jgi:hypothetical protein
LGHAIHLLARNPVFLGFFEIGRHIRALSIGGYIGHSGNYVEVKMLEPLCLRKQF